MLGMPMIPVSSFYPREWLRYHKLYRKPASFSRKAFLSTGLPKKQESKATERTPERKLLASWPRPQRLVWPSYESMLTDAVLWSRTFLVSGKPYIIQTKSLSPYSSKWSDVAAEFAISQTTTEVIQQRASGQGMDLGSKAKLDLEQFLLCKTIHNKYI